jgi:rRNA maturation endonuclease Nob1
MKTITFVCRACKRENETEDFGDLVTCQFCGANQLRYLADTKRPLTEPAAEQ